MTQLPAALAGGIALLACLGGCAGPPARSVYDEGHYAVALRRLIESQPDELARPGGPSARYCLYRGLAHLALNDGRRAEIWLRSARERLMHDPWSLDREERGRLATAWATLGHAPGD